MSWVEKLPSGRYRARYRGDDGAQHSQVFTTKTAAKTFLTTVGADIARGQWIDPRGGQMLFADWEHAWSMTRVRATHAWRAAVVVVLAAVVGSMADLWFQHTSYDRHGPHAQIADAFCYYTRHPTALGVVVGGLVGVGVSNQAGSVAERFGACRPVGEDSGRGRPS